MQEGAGVSTPPCPASLCSEPLRRLSGLRQRLMGRKSSRMRTRRVRHFQGSAFLIAAGDRACHSAPELNTLLFLRAHCSLEEFVVLEWNWSPLQAQAAHKRRGRAALGG